MGPCVHLEKCYELHLIHYPSRELRRFWRSGNYLSTQMVATCNINLKFLAWCTVILFLTKFSYHYPEILFLQIFESFLVWFSELFSLVTIFVGNKTFLCELIMLLYSVIKMFIKLIDDSPTRLMVFISLRTKSFFFWYHMNILFWSIIDQTVSWMIFWAHLLRLWPYLPYLKHIFQS